MTILIDTHVLLWWLDGSDRLGRAAREILTDPENSIYLSAASVWEIAIKEAYGALKLMEPSDRMVPAMMKKYIISPLPVSIAHALSVERLTLHHRDPFDRILIAQAQVEGLWLMTADDLIREYDVTTLDASR